MILEVSKETYRASQLGKEQFRKLLTTRPKRTYNSGKAQKSYNKIVEGLAGVPGAFENIFSKYPSFLHKENSICLRNFKILMHETEYLNQAEIDNLTSYLHKQEDGFI